MLLYVHQLRMLVLLFLVFFCIMGSDAVNNLRLFSPVYAAAPLI